MFFSSEGAIVYTWSSLARSSQIRITTERGGGASSQRKGRESWMRKGGIVWIFSEENIRRNTVMRVSRQIYPDLRRLVTYLDSIVGVIPRIAVL